MMLLVSVPKRSGVHMFVSVAFIVVSTVAFGLLKSGPFMYISTAIPVA